VDAAIRKALEKVPADRFLSAEALARVLDDVGFRYGDPGTAQELAGSGARWKRSAMFGWGAAALLALGLGASLISPQEPARVTREPLHDGVWNGNPLRMFGALAPDGSSMILGVEEGQLGIKMAGSVTTAAIPGTEGARFPVYSPDGASIAYTVQNVLRVHALGVGRAVTLAEDVIILGDAPTAWLDDGTILYQRTAPESPIGAERYELRRVSAADGAEVGAPFGFAGRPVTWVQGLPGSSSALVATCDETCGQRQLYVMDLASGTLSPLVQGVARAWYAKSGHLVYVLRDGSVFAAPFSLRRMEVTGAAEPVIEGVRVVGGGADIVFGEDGTLLYAVGERTEGGGDEAEFVWVSRSGEVSPLDARHTFVAGDGRPELMLSPDGRRLAYVDRIGGNVDVWVKDLDGGAPTRVTSMEERDAYPVWLPDGETLAFAHARGVGGPRINFEIWQRRVDGTGAPQRFTSTLGLIARAISPDGARMILYRPSVGDDAGERGLYVLRLGVDSVPSPLVASDEFSEAFPSISPDGRWLAYVSNETGRREVMVRPFPDVDAGWWQVSQNGGGAPRWAHNGRELFFWEEGEFKAAEFTAEGSVFRRGRVTSLFPFGAEDYLVNMLDPFYDVGPDDQRFLFARPVGGGGGATPDDGPPTLILVRNFFEELSRLVPPN